ncbi:MAG: polysaccharide deacetylase family protein [Candidatus Faecivicinus sp.]|nr:polysaccharide deacetylase family protein [Candidatus Faecivicinus sp.]
MNLHGKMKGITFSYDDGVTQDRRLISLLNRYGMKATFNLNSELFSKQGSLPVRGETVDHSCVSADEVCALYRGHEIAVHTLTHPNLTQLGEDEIVRQVEEDRKNLSRLAGYPVVGMAYPCGGINNDDRVAGILQSRTRILYSRTITSTNRFDPQENLLRFNPTIHHLSENRFELAEQFLSMNAESPQLFYIWGHSYELDAHDGWGEFERLLKMLAFRDEIIYDTNRALLL